MSSGKQAKAVPISPSSKVKGPAPGTTSPVTQSITWKVLPFHPSASPLKSYISSVNSKSLQTKLPSQSAFASG